MKKIISILMLLIPVLLLVFCSGLISVVSRKNNISQNANNVVVMELFTSQGCSSCPPADKLLGMFSKREDVIALSFHVDYWNRLGWKDPFSDPSFSERQRHYASSSGTENVYTPQVIINGEKQMVGSDEDNIEKYVKQYQKLQSSAQIIIDEIKTGDNRVLVTCSFKGKFKNAALNIALVQNKVTTLIKAGENGGVNFTNYNVVRNFKTINSFSVEKNTTTIDLTPGIDKKNMSLILFLQDANSNKIFAAVKSFL